MSNVIVRFFDLYSGEAKGGAGWRQGLVWAATALGVALSPYAIAALRGEALTGAEILVAPQRLIWGLIFGALLLAVAYKLAVAKSSSALALQLGLGLVIGFVAGTIVPFELSGLSHNLSWVFGG